MGKRSKGKQGVIKGAGFKCVHCGNWVSNLEVIGTHQRNHCLFCLWSKHVDWERAGDRKARCEAGMKPVGLTFKRARVGKTGKPRQGELMVVHECTGCEVEAIWGVFEKSLGMSEEVREEMSQRDIDLMIEEDGGEVRRQLWGKK
jgi:hypothetical protein